MAAFDYRLFCNEVLGYFRGHNRVQWGRCSTQLAGLTIFVTAYTTLCPLMVRYLRSGWGKPLFSSTQGAGRNDRLVSDVLLK